MSKDSAEEFTVTLDFGGWETHTKGIGSKLMLKMGYEYGKGRNELQKEKEEVKYPISIALYTVNCKTMLLFLCAFPRTGKNAGGTSRTSHGCGPTKR